MLKMYKWKFLELYRTVRNRFECLHSIKNTLPNNIDLIPVCTVWSLVIECSGIQWFVYTCAVYTLLEINRRFQIGLCIHVQYIKYSIEIVNVHIIVNLAFSQNLVGQVSYCLSWSSGIKRGIPWLFIDTV